MSRTIRTFGELRRSLAALRSSPSFAQYTSSAHSRDIQHRLLDYGCELVESVLVEHRHLPVDEGVHLDVCRCTISRWMLEESEISPSGVIDALNKHGLSAGMYAELAVPTICICLIEAIFQGILSHPRADRNFLDKLLKVLRKVTTFDSEDVLKLTAVDRILRMDPSGTVAKMDDYSVKQLRQAVYRLANKWRLEEAKVALAALAAASKVRQGQPAIIRCQISYYLTAEGACDLADELRLEPVTMRGESEESVVASRHFNASSVGLFSLLLALICSSIWSPPALQIALLLVVIADACSAIYEQVVAAHIPERQLPSLNFVAQGLPESHAAAIVVPCLLSSEENLTRILSLLERNFLRANESSVCMCLLTDYVDSREQQPSATEVALLASAVTAVKGLNDKYAKWSDEPFVMLHRNREFCSSEGVWMGHERKRGKLNALHDLIVRNINSFSTSTGGVTRLQAVKYILLMDEDCVLDANALQVLVGTMAHPLVAPVLTRDGKALERGHAILVPHLAADKLQLTRWANSHLVTGPQEQVGPDRTAMRDITFDVYGAAHYPGKGLYHVEVFDRLCRYEIPDNKILSHDTIEAMWTKPGFVSRARILEGFPCDIDSLAMRRHRWVRGDLQNLAFAFSLMRQSDVKREIPIVSWYILRRQIRSAWSPALIALQLWLVACDHSPYSAGLLLFLLVLALSMPPFVYFGRALAIYGLKGTAIIDTARRCLKDGLKIAAYRIGSSFYQAVMTLDAYTRTLYRLHRKKGLVEWTSASLTDAGGRKSRVLVKRYAAASIAIASVVIVREAINCTLTVPAAVVLTSWILVPACRGWLFSK